MRILIAVGLLYIIWQQTLYILMLASFSIQLSSNLIPTQEQRLIKVIWDRYRVSN